MEGELYYTLFHEKTSLAFFFRFCQFKTNFHLLWLKIFLLARPNKISTTQAEICIERPRKGRFHDYCEEKWPKFDALGTSF